METEHKDRKIAQAICDDIKNGDNRSLNQWFTEHYQEMFRFVLYRVAADRRRVKEEVLQKFYIELNNGNAFCQYFGINGCSLKSYIFGRLRFRCLYNRKKEKSDAQSKPDDTAVAEMKDFDESENGEIPDTGTHTENLVIEKQRHHLLYQALDRLSSDSRTVEDARLLSWILQEIPYDEMAKRLLTSKNMAATDDEIKRESARIRKHVTRPGGSMEKLGCILKQMMGNS